MIWKGSSLFRSGWFKKISDGNVEEVCKVAGVLWGIWHGRNKRVWESKLLSPPIVMA